METQKRGSVSAAVSHVLGQQKLLSQLAQSGDSALAAALAIALGCFNECVGELPVNEDTSAII
jgi:hypothetical protein